MKKLIAISMLSFLLPLTAAASTVVAHSNTTISAGLVGYWPLDGNTTNWATGKTADLSGSGSTGQLVNMSTSTGPVAGKLGGGFNFDGSTNYVNADANIVAVDPTNVTFSLWERTTSTTNTLFLFGRGNSSSNNPVMALTMNYADKVNGAGFGCRSDAQAGNFDLVTDNSAVSRDGKWHHLVGVSYKGFLTLYRDGVQVAQAATTTNCSGPLTLNKQTIGALGRTSTNLFFPGSIDDVRVYNRALSATEVQQLYTSGGGTIAHTNTTTLSSGLVAYWTMDNTTLNFGAQTISDMSGQNNTASLINFTTATSTAPAAGKLGGALNFNGSNQWATISPAVYTRYATTTGYSIAMWVKALPVTGQNQMLYGEGNGGDSTFVSFFSNTGSNKLTVANRNAAGTAPVSNRASTAVVFDGTWHHMVWSDINGSAALYIDGVKDATDYTYTPSGTYDANQITLASRFNGNLYLLKGALDDVRLYNRPLSAKEAMQLYRNGGNKIAHSNPTLASGLVGYWPLDGNTTNWTTGKTADLSGSGNTGQLISLSTSTSPVPGKVGGALNFNGSNSTVTNFTSAISSTNTDRTICAWIKTLSTARQGVVSNRPSTPGWALTINRTTAGNISYINESNVIEAAGGIATGAWYHICASYKASTLGVVLYVNGSAVGGGTIAGADTASGNNGIIGYDGLGYFSGAIDDARAYNRVLSAQEVQQLYAAGK